MTLNTYIQMSAENEAPVLILFLVIIGHAFKSIKGARQLPRDDDQIEL